jgi:hypothetical protein
MRLGSSAPGFAYVLQGHLWRRARTATCAHLRHRDPKTRHPDDDTLAAPGARWCRRASPAIANAPCAEQGIRRAINGTCAGLLRETSRPPRPEHARLR